MDEHTSIRVVRELRKAGWTNARALVGGWVALIDADVPLDDRPGSIHSIQQLRD